PICLDDASYLRHGHDRGDIELDAIMRQAMDERDARGTTRVGDRNLDADVLTHPRNRAPLPFHLVELSGETCAARSPPPPQSCAPDVPSRRTRRRTLRTRSGDPGSPRAPVSQTTRSRE